MRATEVLKKVLQSAEKRPGRVAVVFDLDSTLFCVSPRTQAILHEFIQTEEFKSRFPMEIELLRKVELRPTDWGLKQALERHRAPVHPEFFAALKKFWGRNFFSSKFLHHDSVYPEANTFVRKVRDSGAQIFYLTGRHAHSMYEGTVAHLRYHQFPFEPEGMLHMKPADQDIDEEFKSTWFRQIESRFDEIWFFENEPVIIQQVRATVPKVKIVFVDSTHSGKAEKPSDLPTIGMDYRILE